MTRSCIEIVICDKVLHDIREEEEEEDEKRRMRGRRGRG